MITYRYSKFNSDDNPEWNQNILFSMISDMIMKNDIDVEAALQSLLSKGLPVNLFLKETNTSDLLNMYLNTIQEQIDLIISTYTLKKAAQESKHDIILMQNSILDMNLFDSEIKSRLKIAINEMALDDLFRLRWEINHENDKIKISRAINELILIIEENSRIEFGNKKYKFTGNEIIGKRDALILLDKLNDLDHIKDQLKKAIQNGDIFSFDLDMMAKYLGPESYQEFLERRKNIFNKLKETMKENGMFVEQAETGKMQLSSESIQKIGQNALAAIFSELKTDSSGGSHISKEIGESENVSSQTKPFEFGDSIGSIDISSSVVNAVLRSGQSRPSLQDIEIYQGRGTSKSSVVILLDMSGSMMRSDRFYNAKKMTLALDSLIRREFREDKLIIVGFGTLAQQYSIAKILTIQPYNVTLFSSHVRLRIDMTDLDEGSSDALPLYFTNLQRGLQLSRKLLGGKETQNKQIILITDGVPTAHIEDNVLHVNYPPSPADFEFALKEVQKCNEEKIVINTFLLTSEWEMNYFGEDPFIKRFAKKSSGRIFYPHPDNLGKMVLVDFIADKKKQFSY